ncbi:chondroitin sulfate synthase 1-like [Styela clava]
MECRNILRFKQGSIQFVISVILGWFMSERILSIDKGSQVSFNSNSSFCDPCRPLVCPSCENQGHLLRNTRNLNVENSYFRTYPYKPQNVAEDILSRWRYVTKKHMFENINGEPRVGLNGMWREERESIEKFVTKYGSSRNDNFKSMLRKTDPFYGTIYHVNVEKSEPSGNEILQIRRGFQGSKPKLIDISLVEERKLVTVISPVMKVSQRFHAFLNRFEHDILRNSRDGSGNVKLLFVIFQPAKEDDGSKEVLKVLDNFKAKNPHAFVEHILTTGKFSRAMGLHLGVQKCSENDLMLFLDVDLIVTDNFFNRIRRNTIQNKSVYFPVTYSQYDPNIIDEAAKIDGISSEICQNKISINESTGYWIHYAFGITSMYKSDYKKVGGFKLDIEGWGGEDVDLYKKFISDPDIEVFSAVDQDLIHVYHSRGCDPDLPHDQYRMCVGAWAETLGSQMEVSALYLSKTQ